MAHPSSTTIPDVPELPQFFNTAARDEQQRKVQAAKPVSPFDGAYTAWTAKQEPQTNRDLLAAIDTDLDDVLVSHLGQVSPLAKSHAKLMALDALKRYDPKQAGVKTFLHTQLQGIKRYNQKTTQLLSLPERFERERYALSETEKALNHDLGRDATDDELTDRLGIPAKRLARLRSYGGAVSEGKLQSGSEDGAIFGYQPVAKRDKLRLSTIESIVYGELHPEDKLIMEHTMGLNGREVLSNQDLARKLRKSPGAISQRKAKIQGMLNIEPRFLQ